MTREDDERRSKALEQEPCGKDINVPATDAISRQAVLDAIDAKSWEFCDYLISKGRNDEQKPVSHFADNLRECIREELPSVTPQPRMGKWSHDGSHWANRFICSECGYKLFEEQTKYCPNCGAKMKSEGEE